MNNITQHLQFSDCCIWCADFGVNLEVAKNMFACMICLSMKVSIT